VRVFDIRVALRPREIAYFAPPSVTTPSPGSWNNRTSAMGRPDHCSAQIRLDGATGTLMMTAKITVSWYSNSVAAFGRCAP
jgi:hypothetical protein